jgi:putative transposase
MFVERLWRSVKHESVYLHDWNTVAESCRGLGDYFTFYNHQRAHSALVNHPPAASYFRCA